jgi:hypothetical protein
MRPIRFGVVLLLLSVGCSSYSDDESLSESNQELNGVVSAEGFLKRKSVASTNEQTRRQNTTDYYATVKTAANGGGTVTISSTGGIPTLSAFRTTYAFGSGETVTSYYNRGDLGLGREMHCANSAPSSQVACYVTNFAAGGDGSEFTFGLSRDIAFDNRDAGNIVATVAMVYRPAAATNKIIFAVYGANGALVDNAPLDRHGLNFSNGFAANGNSNPDPVVFGTPGLEVNNHIPSNCLNCHGGSYDESAKTVSGALFLPFDLDQFEYRNAVGETRDEQLNKFRTQNQLVRKVAKGVAGATAPIVKQIDGWYGNTGGSDTLSGAFDSNYVPIGWQSPTSAIAAYRDVIRPACRGCHLASPIAFEDAISFPNVTAAADLASHAMPHALQTQRDFWLSGRPVALEAYFASIGETTAANTLHNAGPGNIVTLDPYLIVAAQ